MAKVFTVSMFVLVALLFTCGFWAPFLLGTPEQWVASGHSMNHYADAVLASLLGYGLLAMLALLVLGVVAFICLPMLEDIVDRMMFGKTPITVDDAEQALRNYRQPVVRCLTHIVIRERDGVQGTMGLRAIFSDIRLGLNDVEVYFRCKRLGMGVAVLECMAAEYKYFDSLMERHSDCAMVIELMRNYLQAPPSVCPPHTSRFHCWMRSYVVPSTASRRNRLGLR
jgi:hypothetical protein